jgi:hypothetical protein
LNKKIIKLAYERKIFMRKCDHMFAEKEIENADAEAVRQERNSSYI